MKRVSPFLFAFIVGSVFATVARAELGSDVRAILQDKLLARSRVSVQVVRLGNSARELTPLFEANPSDALVPASNLKVVTTSAALERLGSDFKFRTLLLQHEGDLVLVGDGDPTLGDAELLKKAGWDVDTVFKTWAAGLARRKTGPVARLVVDDGVFSDDFLHPHWPAGQAQKRYMAEVAGLNLNANCIDVYVKPAAAGQVVGYTTNPRTNYVTVKNACLGGGENRIWLSREPGKNDLVLRGEASEANEVPVSVTIHDPPMYAGTVLAETLAAAGVPVGGVVRDRTARAQYAEALAHGGGGWTLLAAHETPLTTVMARANKDSMNLYAECCCKRLGYAEHGAGTWAAGTASVGEFLQAIGVPADQYHLDDGCGLSKQNVVSASAMVAVLAHNFHGKNAKAFLATMAVAGVDGTMEERFRGSDLRGRVYAKSGFVNGVSCLSGYLHARDDSWFAFSILFNDVPAGGTAGAKAVQEKIVRAVDANCGGRR